MKIVENYAKNNNINIHYMDNCIINSKKDTLVICPGLSECCEDYIKILETINDRRVISLSFRGRGKSDKPYNGYSLENHIEDISAVVGELGLEKFSIMGYSRGVSYVLGYVILFPDKVSSLIIGEYPAIHKKMPNGWAKESMDFYNKFCSDISINYEVLKRIELESKDVDFKEDLKQIKCKSLIIRGELEGALLSKEELINYVNYLGSKSIRVESLENASHDIFTCDFDNVVKIIREFLCE